MQFHAIQHDVIPHDWKGTRRAIEHQICVATPNEGDYVVLPEMSDTGWSMELDEITGIGAVEWACSLAIKHKIWLQVGWANQVNGRGKNCVSICSPTGDAIATYVKVFTCNPHGENNFYDVGTELIVVDLGGISVCPMICYDLRFPELWRPAALLGVDVFTLAASWPLKRISHWRSLTIARAVENQAFVVASNRVGQDKIATWGGNSMICSAFGEILAEVPQTEVHTCSASIDPQIARSWRKEFPVFDDIKQELIGKINVRRITA